MARPDYAAILDRHCEEAETLAGGVLVPELTSACDGVCEGRARIVAEMIYGNRWPALYGGFLFDLADRVGRLATKRQPLSLELHFLKAIRRVDVPEDAGLTVAWRARVTPASADTRAVTIEIGDEQSLYGYGTALFGNETGCAEPGTGLVPDHIVLPAHARGWRAGAIRGRCIERPGSFAAIADTLVAKAMATVRGDGCADDVDERFLVRTLSYVWLEPVDDGVATFEARIVQRGKRLALAAGELSLAGRPVGRTAGTVVVQPVSRS